MLHFCSTLADIVKMLRTQIRAGDPPFDSIVRRGYVLDDALQRVCRSSFHPARSIVVSYVVHLDQL